MIRGLYLGSDGEEAAQKLLDAYDLSSSFQPCLVVSAYPAALAEARRRLAEAADRLIHVEPGGELWPRIEAAIEDPSEDKGRPVVWLQANRFDPEVWGAALASLQQRRESLRHTAPWLWVLAGPPDLVPLVHEKAMHILTGVSVRVFLNEKPRQLPSASQPVRWLHLSDLHFEALERWKRRATLRGLLSHVDKLRAQNLAPDLVFITGDVAFSGRHEEYEQAERFLAELAERLDLDPRERFFLVPGNHDVDRTAIGAGDRRILKSLETQQDVEEILADGDAMDLLGRRLESFYAFTKRFLGPARGWRRERPWRVDVRNIHGVELGIVQLNSAWASGTPGEELLVGEAQVRQALEEAADAYLRIALVHHPLADLRDVDRERLETLYASGGIHFLLRGHLHRTRAEATHSPDGTLVELAAGAAYVGGEWPRTHLLTEIDFVGGDARIHFFRYSAEGVGFWAKDTLSYERAPDGIWTVPLPTGLKLDGAAAEPRELGEARRATLAARYRTAAGAVYGSVRFVGFASHRPRPNVRLPELFVPLRLKKRGSNAAQPGSWPTVELLRRLVAGQEDGTVCRAVVLGGPGSGKTTLCRFVATVIAGEATVDGVDVADDLLPFFLPLREAVQEEPGGSFLDLLVDQARTRLQVALPEGFLEESLKTGRAVLILDGVDEVGSAAEREGLRERLQAFCRLHSAVSILVTSRVAGYDEAPLSRVGPDAFEHFSLASFNDGDLELFVSSWYAVQEPADPVARDRGIADLTAAFKADSQVRELARNPMLATLIALVHRFEAHLPGERAALYEICVKTLLETWPRATRREFKEIDAGLQRAYMEALAYRMQQARAEKRITGEYGILVKRPSLVDALSEIVQGLGGGAANPAETRSLVERWIDFLEQGTGLLVEQRPRWYSFFHLSFMEYLAAAALESETDTPPETVIADHHGEELWQEVCLLAVGIHATDKRFLGRLFHLLRQEPGGTSFLLLCLCEEATFVEQQRTEILRGALRTFLQRHDSYRGYERKAMLDLLGSRRHGEWVRRWLREEAGAARGLALQALVAMLSAHEVHLIVGKRLRAVAEQISVELLKEIQQRPDGDPIAGDLLEFWPGSDIGTWAWTSASTASLLEWSLETPGELLVLRAATSLSKEKRAASSLVVGLAQSAGKIVALAARSEATTNERADSAGRPSPEVIRVRPGSLILGSRPKWPTECYPEPGGAYIASGFIRAVVTRFGESSLPASAALSVEDLDWDSPGSDPDRIYQRDYFQTLCQALRQTFAWELGGHILYENRRDPSVNPRCVRSYDQLECQKILEDAYIQECAIEVLEPRSFEVHLPAPDRGVEPAKGTEWQRTRSPSQEPALIREVSIAAARLVAEAWIATATTLNVSREDQLAYVHRRVQNAWMLQSWSQIDELWQDRTDPDLSALYLALGFSQATTTGQWPATECWVELFRADSPRHWLPRAQCHLCWLLHDPADAGHRQAMAAALDEGRDDADRPGVAAALQQLFGA